MTESGKAIADLQTRKALLLKRFRFNEKQISHYKTKLEYHQYWFARRTAELTALDNQLNELLDAKLSTLDTIQRESGEWSDAEANGN